jgi:hypothetical protein
VEGWKDRFRALRARDHDRDRLSQFVGREFLREQRKALLARPRRKTRR